MTLNYYDIPLKMLSNNGLRIIFFWVFFLKKRRISSLALITLAGSRNQNLPTIFVKMVIPFFDISDVSITFNLFTTQKEV